MVLIILSSSKKSILLLLIPKKVKNRKIATLRVKHLPKNSHRVVLALKAKTMTFLSMLNVKTCEGLTRFSTSMRSQKTKYLHS